MNNLLPPLSTAEREALKASIAELGVREPIKLDADTGIILDGRNRAEIAAELKVDCPSILVICKTDAEREAYALSANTNRRNLSPDQRAELRATAQRIYFALRDEGKTQKDAAALVGVAQRTGSDWDSKRSVSDSGTAKANNDRRVTVTPAQKTEIVERVEAGETQAQVAADYSITRPRVTQIVSQHRAAQREPEPVVTPGFPDGPFRCIVIDPPWPIEKIEREERPNQGQRLDYAVMSLDKIAELPISNLANPDGCHLYLWVTHKFLPAGLELFDTWGAKYQCVMTWVKNVGITPFSWMYSTEHVLFGRIGSLPLEQNGLRLDFSAPVTKHSAKPDVFYERVIQASPEPRLEMFARVPRDGFIVWGNEVEQLAS